MVAAIDVEGLPCDELGGVQRQEGGGGADVVDVHERPCRRLAARLLQQLVEVGDAGRRAGGERPYPFGEGRRAVTGAGGADAPFFRLDFVKTDVGVDCVT